MFRKFITRLVLPLAILAAAGAMAREMVASTPTVSATPSPSPPPRVEVLRLRAETRPAVVSGTGIVEAAREMTVVPEVSGRVVYQAPELAVGGRVRSGEVLLRIDRSAYALALRQQRSQVQQAELERELEAGRGEMARREWALLQQRDQAASDPGRLASRQAQAEAAAVGVDAAQGALDRARLDLKRTVIRAPFDATVVRENVETGQVVGAGAALATLVGTDEVWARVAVPIDALQLFEVPAAPDELGSPAAVSQLLPGGGTATWDGAVRRLVYELDAESRMLMVLVAVRDPFAPSAGRLPLLPGAFVSVEIRGRGLAPTFAVPRRSLFEGRRVWTVADDNRLRRHDLVVAWGDADHVYVRADESLADGVRILAEPPANAVDGMLVEPQPVSDPMVAAPGSSVDDNSPATAASDANPIPAKAEG
ncbi:MAG: efflux RND transporter periplasmic adaptor subunit [Myxococcales bacterium FL481]|nr:MAG: efflux RND transporter periplasmic adaptor subunit [Myxococcales bacterium FL481]